MRLYLTTAQLQAIEHHAQATYPQECCGVLVGQRHAAAIQVSVIYPVDNAWSADCLPPETDPAPIAPHSANDRYWIDPADLFRIMKSSRASGLAIVGIYHSHPDHPAIPSECDRRLAWPEYGYVIVAVQLGEVVERRCWQLDSRQALIELPIQVTHSA